MNFHYKKMPKAISSTHKGIIGRTNTNHKRSLLNVIKTFCIKISINLHGNKIKTENKI